ncbi:MAG: hypothetical protein N2C14_17135, partial [Planctomycetales bacterium]
TTKQWRAAFLLPAGALLFLGLTGCQSEIGGQILPSPNYMGDDVQFFPAGTEFKLPQEAAALESQRAQEAQGQF